MRLNPLPFISLTTSLLVWGCAERNNPVVSHEKYAFNLISRTQTLGWARDVWVYENTAYIADGEQGVSVWDVTDLTTPVLIDTIITTDEAYLVAFSPLTNLLMVHDRSISGGVSLINKGTKQRVASIGSGTIDGFVFEESAHDTIILVVADRTDGIFITKTYYDSALSYWETTELSSSAPVSRGTVRNVAFEGNTIFAAHNQLGIDIIEVGFNNIGNFPLTQIGSVNTPGAAFDIAMNARGNRLFVADYQAGLRVFDISDHSKPTELGYIIPDRVDRVIKVVAQGDTAYFIDQNSALYAVDARNPSAPTLIGQYDLPTPTDLFVRDDGVIFVADADLGLVILAWR